jgi:hypothetical protein
VGIYTHKPARIGKRIGDVETGVKNPYEKAGTADKVDHKGNGQKRRKPDNISEKNRNRGLNKDESRLSKFDAKHRYA